MHMNNTEDPDAGTVRDLDTQRRNGYIWASTACRRTCTGLGRAWQGHYIFLPRTGQAGLDTVQELHVLCSPRLPIP